MELSNEFEVAVPVEQAWAVLTDIERIAPCLPGAQLQEIEGDDFKGIVKIKVGPITAQYKGTASFVEKDDDAHTAVLTATGRDTRGQGNASATIVAQLESRGDDLTHVSVLTDLAVTGKVAQFGRGVMADVSAKLLDQFVENLETTVLADLSADLSAEPAADAPAEHAADLPAERAAEAAAGTTDAPAAAAGSAAAEAATGSATTAAPENEAAEALAAPTSTGPAAPGEVARKARTTTEMLASELAKAWEEAKEGIDDTTDETPRVEREPLAPRPDLLVPEATADAAAASAEAVESAEEPAAEEPAAELLAPTTPERRIIDSPEAEPIDLLGTAGSPVLQRAAPLLGVAAVVLVLLAVLRRRRRRRRS